jgi:hypothetical protein
MHSISLILIGVLLAVCPFTHGTTTESTELEEPKILPLTDALKTSSSVDDTKTPFKREVWQEDDREVLIRNERGTKDNGSGSTTSGKKQKDNTHNNNNKKDKNSKNAQKQHLNKTNSDTNPNSDTTINTTTQETVKKHQHHQQKHEKHEKNVHNNNRKHASTEKPKQKDESKTN